MSIEEQDLTLQSIREVRYLQGATDRERSWIKIHSPIDGSLLGEVAEVHQEDINGLFTKAKIAQKAWAMLPIHERVVRVLAWADILYARRHELAERLTWEIGKNPKDAIDEIVRSVDLIRYTAEDARRIAGEVMHGDAFPGMSRQKTALVTRVPVGVVLAIPPFNYPVNLAISKIAPALVVGNAIILKPPTQGALVAHDVVESVHAASIPADLLQLAVGRGNKVGDALVAHKDVNMIAFTGSTPVGHHIASLSRGIPMQMELGGKDAAIVLADADLDRAASEIVAGGFSYSGQRCTAVKRVLVHESVADELANLVAMRVQALRVGDPREGATVVPLINKKAADYVWGLYEEAMSKGALVRTGGRRTGNLISPTVLDYVTTDMRVAWEEPFGPLLPFIRVKNAKEAVEIANRSEYGLQAAVFTRNEDAAFAIAEALEVGSVQVNAKTSRGPDHFPFVAVKHSGVGTQGIRYSLEAMSRIKSVVLHRNPVDLADLQ